MCLRGSQGRSLAALPPAFRALALKNSIFPTTYIVTLKGVFGFKNGYIGALDVGEFHS